MRKLICCQTPEERLCVACRRPDLKAVHRLLDEGANVHVGNDQPLADAAFFGRLQVTNLLLARGADATVNSKPLRWAIWNDHFRVAEVLVKAGAPLHEVIESVSEEDLAHLKLTKADYQQAARIQLSSRMRKLSCS